MIIPLASERGGVMGAIDNMRQRGKIQEEPMYYEVFNQIRKKHDGSLPLVGVSTICRRMAGESRLRSN